MKQGIMNSSFTLKYFTDRDKWFSFWSLLVKKFYIFKNILKRLHLVNIVTQVL